MPEKVFDGAAQERGGHLVGGADAIIVDIDDLLAIPDHGYDHEIDSPRLDHAVKECLDRSDTESSVLLDQECLKVRP